MKTYVTVHAIAVNNNNQYLILQRAAHRSSPGTWNWVTGYIQERESAEAAALRELKEETGLLGEVVKSTEPFYQDVEDIRWVVIASLIKVKDLAVFALDENESQSFRWVGLNDELINNSITMQNGLRYLGLLT